MKFIYSLFLLVFFSFQVLGQANGDFRSHQTGNWDVASTWERFNGTSWVTPAPIIPSSSDGVITVQNGHIVTVVGDATVDQLVIGSGGILTLDPSSGPGVPITFTINNGAGTDLAINSSGQLNLLDDGAEGSLVAVSSSASVVDFGAISINDPSLSNFDFSSNSSYSNNTNGAIIPFSNWGTNSTCTVSGVTNTPVSGLDQAFYNFTWSCASQSVAINIGLTSATSFAGDFTVSSTNGLSLQLNTSGTYNINFAKNFSVSGTARVTLINASPGSATLNISGNFSYTSSGSSILANTGTCVLNVAGNFTASSGTLTKSGGVVGSATIIFNGSSAQSYTGGATITGAVAFQVSNGSILDVGTSPITATNASSTFTLNSGATLRVGALDAAGAIQSNTTAGNIRVGGTRTYTSGSTIIYNGSSAQFMGSGHPSGAGINTQINNSSGVSLATSVALGGNLTLTSGNLAIGANTLTLNAGLTPNANFLSVTSSSNLIINGTGSLGTLALTGGSLNNFTLNRTSSGSATLGSSLTIGGTFTQTNGDLDLNGNTLRISGAYSRSSGNLLSNSSSTLIVDGSGALPSGFNFGGGLALNTLTLNRFSATLTTSASLAITNLNLNSGTFNNTGTITMASGGTITRLENGSMSNAPNATSSYNVVYNISAPINTSVELPIGTTQLNNLTKQGSDILTLNSAITVNGILTLSNGSFKAGANAINLKGNFVSNAASVLTSTTTTFSGTSTLSGSTTPTFGNITITGSLTPSIPYAVSGGVLTNNGTLSAQSVTFTGVSSIAGSSSSPFINVTISSGTLAAPSTAMNVSGNFSNSGIFTGSASGSLNVTGNLTNNATFTATSGAITVTGDLTNLGAFTAPSTSMSVSGNFSNSGAGTTFTVLASGSLSVAGNLTNSATFTATSGAITVTGDITNGGTFTSTSGLLNLAGNFVNNSTFTHNGGTVVFNGTTSISGSSAPTFRHITISGTLNSPSTLNLVGNFTNNGTFNRSTGTVQFSGTSTQQIAGSATTDFNNITVTNTTGPPAVQVQHNSNLRGVLTLSSNAVFDADGSANTSVFTLISTADQPTGDAAIATLPSGASITGKVTAQRYMSIQGPNSARIYRYISSPVASATVADLQNEIPITGTFTTPSTCSGCVAGNQSMWRYNEAVAGSLNLGYVDFPSTTNIETFVAGKGYDLYVRGNVLSSPVWDLTGTPNQGTTNFNVTYTSSGSSANDGWNLVGNPYPSTIDWNAASGWTKTNLSSIIYMRDNSNTGSIATWNGTLLTGTNGGSRYIAMGQGFWVQTNGSSPSLIATESVKSPGTSTTFFREQTPQDLLRITLVQGSKRDESIINFRSDAAIEIDKADAWKWKNNTIFNLSSLTTSGIQLAINSLPSIDCSSSVKLDISEVKPGNYSLEFSQFESFNNSFNIILTDKFTSKSFDVKSGAPYLFAVTSNVASYKSGRFSILFTLADFDPQFSIAAHDVCSNKDASINLTSKQGFNYALYKSNVLLSDNAGTGSDLSLTIPKDKLDSGVNSFIVKSYAPACSSATIQKTITINSLDVPQITGFTATKSCLTGSVSLNVSSTSKNDSYHWYDSQSAMQPIAGEVLPLFKTPVLQKSKTYYVAAANSIGCEGTRSPVLAEVIQFDPVQISQDATSGALISSYLSGNQWYIDDQPILGANQSVFTPKSVGAYTVKVDLGNGCTTSGEFVIAGDVENSILNSIKVYPNPILNTITVYVDGTIGVKKSMIVNTLGQEIGEVVFKEKEGHLNGEFDMTNKPAGVYLLKLDLQNGQSIHYNLIKK